MMLKLLKLLTGAAAKAAGTLSGGSRIIPRRPKYGTSTLIYEAIRKAVLENIEKEQHTPFDANYQALQQALYASIAEQIAPAMARKLVACGASGHGHGDDPSGYLSRAHAAGGSGNTLSDGPPSPQGRTPPGA